jgi:putative phosphoesterase
MKIGVISDVHNNVVALNGVLDKFHMEGCEQIICCGDIIGIGPYPEETVQRIMQIPDIIAVRGNHEKYLLEGMPTQVPNEEDMGYEEMEYHKWEHSLLSNESIRFLRGLDNRNDFVLGGFRFAVMHYGMDSLSNRYINYIHNPKLEDCYQMFSDVDADVILYGHDHKPSVNRDERRLFANFGSLGCPVKDGNVARAGILTINNGKLDFEAIKVLYEVDKVIADINRLAYPASKEIKMIFFNTK